MNAIEWTARQAIATRSDWKPLPAKPEPREPRAVRYVERMLENRAMTVPELSDAIGMGEDSILRAIRFMGDDVSVAKRRTPKGTVKVYRVT